MKTNRLAQETSPYLLQHAHNPVDWFPWGQEALQKAQQEDKPLLLSIGYSACHWCHVMERECFENEGIAALMNQHFVCIKIDREERPDIDAIYMDAVQAMGLRGGWPLNVFLMPDAKPFYGGTYFPPKNWTNLLWSVQEAFQNNRAALQNSADGFANNLGENIKFTTETQASVFSTELLSTSFKRLSHNFDTNKGGMNRAPKFPMPSIWKFVLRYFALTKDPEALQQAKLTFDRLALGGIYDQIGGSWARYSTDEDWFCPHFEKMLYDNGQLLSLFSAMYQLTQDELYKKRVYQTIEWLEREMMHPKGGFYSALDADSEGEEGKFYVWKKHEIEAILGKDAPEFCKLFDFSEDGNWEHGNNIIHRATRMQVAQDKLDAWFEKLFQARSHRIRPGLDDKVLCSWNGLALKGLTDAYRVFNEESFLKLAVKTADFIYEKLSTEVRTEEGKKGRGLWHSFAPNKDKAPSIIGFLEDYAAVIEAYLSLYQATFEEKWLQEAEQLTDYCLSNFYDENEGFFFFTDVAGEVLIARKKELFDNVIPASNSIMAENLFCLGILLENSHYQEVSRRMMAKMQDFIQNQTEWVSNWASLATYKDLAIIEVAIVGEKAQEIRQALEVDYLPNRIFVGTKTTSNLPLLQNRTALGGETTIYVCQNKTCELPTHEVETARELIKKYKEAY